MTIRAKVGRLAATAFLSAGLLVVGVASAQAISIESAHNIFEKGKGGIVNVKGSGGSLTCEINSYSGTDNKTNHAEVTPTFEKCGVSIYKGSYKNTSECSVGHSVPWTWTLNAGTKPNFTGNVTINCVSIFEIGPACKIRIPSQSTTEGTLTWQDDGAGEQNALVSEKNLYLSYTSSGLGCESFGWQESGHLSIWNENIQVSNLWAK